MRYNATKITPEEQKIFCPICKEKMIVKTRKSDGNKFWGCSGYHSNSCTFTMELEESKSDLSVPINRYLAKMETARGGK